MRFEESQVGVRRWSGHDSNADPSALGAHRADIGDIDSVAVVVQDLIGWKKTVNKFLWITATAAIGALVTTIWRMVISSGVQS